MKGLKYQLKNIRRDKLCILTFLLPVIAGVAINLLSGVSLQALSENTFYIVENEISYDTVKWLDNYGKVTDFKDIDALKNAVNNPATQGIGVVENKDGINTLLSGDELQINRVIGNTLPQIFAERDKAAVSDITIIPAADSSDGIKSLLIVITMITAMFMGCTFNAMSIIGEKEDGIALINEILPVTSYAFAAQKIVLGLIGGIISTALTACICMRVAVNQVFPLAVIIVLSAFIAALTGMFIGHFSNGLMVGIACIKMAMILIIAPPIFIYLTAAEGSLIYTLSYLLPSSAAFYGLMNLMSGNVINNSINILVLLAHCVIWMLLFLAVHSLHKRTYIGHRQNTF